MEPAQEQEEAFIGASITLRVSRDGGRTWGPTTVYQPSRKEAPFDLPGRFPPCAVPPVPYGRRTVISP
ncbi:hypothetical protein [Streptomyces sp. NPDC047043]|uniref:hypothetical protein n=1 Tax=Streptomyces sp. NPDC047043 TaxID=3154497 RepID=UPI0033F41D3E